MKYGVDLELEAEADAFLRAHGEEPTKLAPMARELEAWAMRAELVREGKIR